MYFANPGPVVARALKSISSKVFNRAAVAACAALAASGVSHAQAGVTGPAFACNGDLYQIRSGATDSTLIRLPESVLLGPNQAVSAQWGPIAPALNAIGFNRPDGFIYGLVAGTGQPTLYRMGTTGSALVGTIVTQGLQTPALTASFVPTGGTFDSGGRYYFIGQGGGNIVPSAVYRVDDLTTDVDTVTAGVQLAVAAVYPIATTLPNLGDFAFGTDGNLYAATGTTAYQIALPTVPGPATVTTQIFPAAGTVGGIGSAFIDSQGRFFVFNNGGQNLFQVTVGLGDAFGGTPPTIGPAVNLTNAATASNTDGASCLPQADMAATGNTLPTVITAGQVVTGQITCRNNGADAAGAATCTIPGLPLGATTVCAPPTPTASPLASGSDIVCNVTYTAPASGTVTATVTAGSTTADPNLANNTTPYSATVQAAPVAANDTGTTPANTTFNSVATVISNDTGTGIAITSLGGTACSVPCTRAVTGGSLTVNADGTYSLVPTPGFSGVVTVPYIITDSAGQTSTANIVITVTPTAAPNTGSDVVDGATGTPGATSLLANDVGTSLTVSAIGGCTTFPCTITTSNGSVTVQSNGTYVFTATSVGTSAAIPYTARDASGQEVTSTLTLTSTAAALPDLVTTVTLPPVAPAPGSPVTATVSFGNVGVGVATDVAVTLQLPPGATGVVPSNGGVYDPVTGRVTWPVIATIPANTPTAGAYTVAFTPAPNTAVTVRSDASTSSGETTLANNPSVAALAGVATPVPSLQGLPLALLGLLLAALGYRKRRNV
jgi:Bacterial Ig domain/Domain of unknown function DUF11